MTILIIGADGQLGKDLVDELGDYVLLTPTREELDITNFNRTREYIEENDPDYIISTAAYHDLDRCEQYPNKAFEVNAFATKNLAEICQETLTPLIWISTNYVFSGEKGNYTEKDEPSPINIYGLSKLAGEHFIRNILYSHYIIRTAGLFSENTCKGKGGRNIVDTLRSIDDLKAKNDEFFTITYTKDLAKAIHHMIVEKAFGTYHLFNEGRYTVYQIAKMLREDVKGVSREDFDNKAIYPEDASLATIKDLRLPPVKNAIRRYLDII